LVVQYAARAGVAVGRYPPAFSPERQMGELLRALRINCVLDVGAFHGEYAAQMRSWGFAGRLISFEPVPDAFEQLQRSMGHDPLWQGKPYGLSDASGVARMNTYAVGQFNSLLSLKAESESAYKLDSSRNGTVNIQLHRLDEVLPDLLRDLPDPRVFVKTDTQGHDTKVIQGASGVLHDIVGFQAELPAVKLYEGMASMSEALDLFGELGFVPVGFYPVNTFSEHQVSPEFDVMFVRFGGSLSGWNEGV
jgi:FkbM family methyltransferase